MAVPTTPYWEETVRLWREVPLKCKNGHWYKEINNLGQWRCTQHACQDYDYSKGEWPCCRKTGVTEAGCIPADHNCTRWPFTAAHTLGVADAIDPGVLKLIPEGPGVTRGITEIAGVRILGGTVTRYDEAASERKNPFDPDGWPKVRK
jgi:hypothetical protein